MTGSNIFSTEEWTLLQRAPFLVFYFVANADDNIEPHEVEKLIKQLEAPERYESNLFSQVITDVMSDPENLAVIVGGITFEQDQDLNAQLVAVQAMVDTKLHADDAVAFKKALVALGVDIATATGDVELPLSKEEWAEVERFKRLLKLK